MTLIHQILFQAEQFAKEISPSPSEDSSWEGGNRTHVSRRREAHHYHYGVPFLNSWWGWGINDPVIHFNRSCERKENNKRERAIHFLISAAATMIVLGSSFFIGADAAGLNGANNKLRQLQMHKMDLEPDELTKVERVIEIQTKMLEDLKTTYKIGCLAKGLLALSAAAIAGDYWMENPSVSTAGGIGLALSSAFLIARRGYIDSDTAPSEDASLLLNAVAVAKQSS